MLRGQQTLVLSMEWRRISTHHITLGTAPIGGHHATVSASHLPAEPSSVGAGSREGGGSAPAGNGPGPQKLPNPQPLSPRPCPPRVQFVILFICVTVCFQSLLQAPGEQD